ncbi:MAG: DUF2293 domain-containing protein [Chthoniobacteraceae bacterium]
METDLQPPPEKPGEIAVFIIRRESKCTTCGETLASGRWIRIEDGDALCLACADLDHLEYLPSGDAALTRRAGKFSPIRAVVLQWARVRKRYERQGILVTAEALQKAEEECLADAPLRERRRVREAVRRADTDRDHVAAVVEALRAQFPRCPADEARRIAEWTCEKRSGRVGRTAAAIALDPQPLRLAVIAHIRHAHTRYGALLMSHGDRRRARDQVAAEIDRVLRGWES